MRNFIVILLCVFVLCFFVQFVFSLEEYKTADDEAKAYNVTRVVKTVDGLKFSVQEDYPIEKVAGVYRPIDIDSYVAMRIGKIQKKMNEADMALLVRIEGLFKKLSALEKKVDKILLDVETTAAKNQADPAAHDQPAAVK